MAAQKTEEHYELRARIAKALGHAGRLMILDVLGEEGEASVGDLAERLAVDQSTVSRHLALLRQVGIVGARRESGQHFYTLRVKCLDGFWQCVEGVLASQAAEHEEIVSAERVALIRPENLRPARRRR
jgi:ArsR family transcriptional regulator